MLKSKKTLVTNFALDEGLYVRTIHAFPNVAAAYRHRRDFHMRRSIR